MRKLHLESDVRPGVRACDGQPDTFDSPIQGEVIVSCDHCTDIAFSIAFRD